MDTRMHTQIREGMDVLDRDGDKIGKAGEQFETCFNVDAGFLGTKEYYVPFDAVTEVRDDEIYVSANKDELDDMGWDRRPEERSGKPSTMRSSSRTTEGEKLQLRQEELTANKSSVETGRVRLEKEIVEENRTMEVPVSREEVYVERRPVDRRPSDRPIDPNDTETIDVPVREERVEVEKRPVVYEEVGVGKRETQDTEHVSDTVRREELRTDKEGDVDLRDRR